MTTTWDLLEAMTFCIGALAIANWQQAKTIRNLSRDLTTLNKLTRNTLDNGYTQTEE
jgi:hypothetical protein